MKSSLICFLFSATSFLGYAPAQPRLFAPAPNSPIAVAGGPGNVALADVNQDAKLDLVVACGKSRSMTVLLGLGNGQFRATRHSPFSVPDHPHEIVLGDVNSDGRPDFVFASHDSYGITLMLGDGSGGFDVAPNSPVTMKEGQHPHTHGLAIGDFNGDGKLDFVTANSADNDVAVVFGDGRGGFARAAGSPFSVGKSPYPLTLGDLDNDGHLDIVSTSTAPASRALTVLFGNGRGGFQPSQVPMRTVTPWFVVIGEVNGDGKPDMVSTHSDRSRLLTVLLGDGKGRFTEATGSPFDLGHAAWHVAIVEVNRDGKADVLAAADNGVAVMLGDGHGKFTPAPGSPFPTGKGTWRLAVGDINRDGKPDVATSNLESNGVSVLLAQ